MIQVFRTLSVFFCFSCFATDLTLEEKVGQIFMVHFRGEEPNEDSRVLIQDLKVGGIVYYNWANGLTSPAQVQRLSCGLQAQASTRLLIAVDQEGGKASRLKDGFFSFPENGILGKSGDLKLAEESAFVMGQGMMAVGVNMNFAPVVDVNVNPKNPIIGPRSFGNTPEIVCAFGEKVLLGYHKAGVITTLKHYPGHGDVEIDSHDDQPIVTKSMEDLEKTELFPFAALHSLSDAVMTAHIRVPAIDPDHCSTLSFKTLSYLRERMGFRGVIVSDSLAMGGILKETGTADEAAIQALNAGCDLLLFSGNALIKGKLHELTVSDIKRIRQSVVEAVKQGRILEERLDEAVLRVKQLKERLL